MSNKFWELTFSPGVKEVQEKFGSRRQYARFEDYAETNTVLADSEIEFISQRDGFYLATIGKENQPYIQFRGGNAGFLKVLDEKTLGFGDFRGNRQYISVGNLHQNNKAALFLMDYANRRRLKILAETEISESPEVIDTLKDSDYQAKIERAIILRVNAFDWNCPQHITPRYTAEEVNIMIQPLYEQIGKLEKEIEHLKAIK